jgi:hypothetical protein
MACHEVAALRLGMMRVLGIQDEAERLHELAEIGDSIKSPGSIRSLSEAQDLASLKRFFESSLSGLEEKVARTKSDDPKLPYYRSLIVLTKKVEMDLRNQIASLTQLYRDLDTMHDFLHELYPAD